MQSEQKKRRPREDRFSWNPGDIVVHEPATSPSDSGRNDNQEKTTDAENK